MAAEIREFCPKCGRKREGEEKFCPNDATPYEVTAPAAEADTPAAAAAAGAPPPPVLTPGKPCPECGRTVPKHKAGCRLAGAAAAQATKKGGGIGRFFAFGCLGVAGLFVLI